jgi:hypothetical protein
VLGQRLLVVGRPRRRVGLGHDRAE